jgi:hypothetical protein
MGLRETYGQLVEDLLNAALDKYLDADTLKKQINEAVNKMIDEKLESIKKKLKAEVIDRIDGEDDIPNE